MKRKKSKPEECRQSTLEWSQISAVKGKVFSENQIVRA